jgi:hypothetical protein
MKEPTPDSRWPEVEQHSSRNRRASRAQPQAVLDVGTPIPFRGWVHARVRPAPRLLTQAPRWVRELFEHDWAPVEALSAQARLLPAGLWTYLLTCTRGFVVIYLGDSQYLPGPTSVRGQSVHNVAFVSVEDLARGNDQPLHVIGHLIDHHLGCGGDLEGSWLTGGAGVTPAWQQAAKRLAGLYPLDYGVDEVARSNIQDYFAQSLAIYCRDRQRLNVADPQICRWLRDTLFDERFWH